MERRGSSPGRPRSLRLRDVDPSWKSASASPASEPDHQQFTDDLEKYNEITDFVKEVDEILDHIKPFPRGSVGVEEAPETMQPTRRLDHLENLIKLVEQLKDLKEKSSTRQQQNQLMKEFARERRRDTKLTEPDIPPPPPDPPKKHRPSLPFRKSNRSKSLTAHEYFNPNCLQSQRKSLTGQGKGKVSKWTKVKEAFRWEKASSLENRLKHIKEEVYPSYDSNPNMIAESLPMTHLALPNQLLQVPEKAGDTPSPADSVLSGQVSSCGSSLGAASSSCLLASSGYSGEHSHSHSSDLLTSSTSHADYLGQSLPELSSSSDDERNDDRPFSPFAPEDSCKSRSIYEEVEARRSKSLDGENILVQNPHLLHLSKESLQDDAKAHKQHKTPWGKVIDIIQTRKDSLKKRPKKDLKIEADVPTWTVDSQYSDDVSSPEDAPKDMKPTIEITYERAPQVLSQFARCLEPSRIRPLTPVLTLTRPSTEELQNIQALDADDCEQQANLSSSIPVDRYRSNEQPDEKINMESADDNTRRCWQEKKLVALPPQGRGSRWGRVKKAFLTSAAQDELATGPISAPSSPSYLGSFFSDNESDELSSGEWVEDKHEKHSDTLNSPTLTTTFLEAEVKRNLSEMEKTVSRELDQNLKACELVKTFTEKLETTDEMPRRPRESLSIPLPTIDDLSPEFKKKLDEWKKIKKTPATPTSAKDEPPGYFISKIGEWPKWRPGSSSSQQKTESHHYKQEHHLHEEFYKKLEEWQMLKSGKRSRSQSDRGNKDDRERQTPSPGLSRKNSKGASKKITSGKSSGTESLSGSLKEKEGRASRKSHKEKDLQWLEKELHKIEREKLRLEREREKYLEREARLEQMKRTMGTTTPSQEVLIQTATGFFRFQGISQKFTKKLYEWEKARGIAPEASTFALLERASVSSRNKDERPVLQRSKSVGSAIDSSSAAALSNAHHPSSLSLNDVDDLEAMDSATLLGLECVTKEEDEPEAIIVDVEDVVEETAAMMDDEPFVQGQVPVYSYAPEEITRLIDSSGSECEHEIKVLESEQKKISDETVTLIEENLNLLDKLEKKEAICREIESNLEGIEEKIEEQDDASTPPEELLILEGENLKHSFLEHSEQQQELAHDLVDNFRLLQAASSNETSSVPYNVNQALDLSSQLLSLAQKLENTLNERNEDVKQQRKNIFRRRARAKVNRLGNAKVWYSTDEEPTSPDRCLKPLDDNSSLENIDVEDLPTLITKKVLELKSGLSRLKQSTEPNYLEQVEEDDNTASFTVQMSRTNARASVVSISDTAKMNTSCEDLSPVSVTVSPPQWPRRASEAETSIAKSKAQVICSQDAEEVYGKNLKLAEQKVEQKSPEVLKKKIKEKILEMQRMSSEVRPRITTSTIVEKTDDLVKSDDDEDPDDDSKVVVVKKNGRGNRPKKTLKTRRVTDTTIAYKTDDDDNVRKGFSEMLGNEELATSTETPTFVFVPTTRKIISPVETDTSSSVISYIIDDIEPKIEESSGSKKACEELPEVVKKPDIGIPPVPQSPNTARKTFQKETAPSIRMMIAKYNQRLTEQENNETTSGTASPVGWRSPVLDRRIREQLDRFQKDSSDPLRFGGKFNREVHKSSSAGFIKSDLSSPTTTGDTKTESAGLKGILKSSSTGTVTPPDDREIPKEIKPEIRGPLALRALRIQQAKADFFAKGPGGQSWSSEVSSPTSVSSVFSWKPLTDRQDSATEEMKIRNRMSHASVGSESSFDEVSYGDDLPNLIKSASAGMINLVSPRRLSDEVEQPCIQKSVTAGAIAPVDESTTKRSSKFGISNIKSRFRKVKMRKSRDKESAVSTLCRQSLLLDVSRTADPQQPSCSKSCPSSPVLERTTQGSAEGKRWVPRYFKNKESKRPSSGSDASGNV